MKLVRYGEMGAEKPGLIDKSGQLRDLSGHIKDLHGEAYSPASLKKLAAVDPASLPAVSGKPRLGAPVVGISNLGHRGEEPITAGGDRLDAAPFGAILVEHPAEGGDLDRQIGVLDHRPPPDGGHDLLFRDQFARPLDEHPQNVEGSGAYR